MLQAIEAYIDIRFPGSVEDSTDKIHSAVMEFLKTFENGKYRYANVAATYSDRVIVQGSVYDSTTEKRNIYALAVKFSIDSGAVKVGEIEPIEIRPTIVSLAEKQIGATEKDFSQLIADSNTDENVAINLAKILIMQRY